jgi:hypothetical protein
MIFPYRLEARTAPSRTMQLAVPLIAALLTLALGFLIFGLVGRDPLEAMHAFFIEPLSDVNGWSELLLKASPLCLIGLGLAIGYRANVWNIGAEGQMVLGGIAASGVAIYFDQASGWWILPTMMLAGVVGGMVWAAIPAFLKSRYNTNEILTSLMLTYVATQLLIYLVSGPWRDPQGMNFPLSEMFSGDALYPTFSGDWHWKFLRGTRLNASIFARGDPTRLAVHAQELCGFPHERGRACAACRALCRFLGQKDHLDLAPDQRRSRGSGRHGRNRRADRPVAGDVVAGLRLHGDHCRVRGPAASDWHCAGESSDGAAVSGR